MLLVRKSKTDQAGAGQFVFLHAASQRALCPVRSLNALAMLTPVLTGPIFTGQLGGIAVSKVTMLSRLHRLLTDLSRPTQLYGLHSLRSGGATAAAQGLVPERMIKAHGRWISDTVRIYTSALPSGMWEVTRAMGT